MGAVFAQFKTPFEIQDQAFTSYHHVMYLRVPRDSKYTPPSPERPSRGWIVARMRTNSGYAEMFRADVNMFMDGGLSVIVEDAQTIMSLLVASSAYVVEDAHGAARVLDAILQRIDGIQSPWAKVDLGSVVHGLSVFHEKANGEKTKQHFVVDVRLERLRRKD